MTADARAEVRQWIFTFGFGHVHPHTGVELKDCFIRIPGTFEDARTEMVRRFGAKWAGQYETEDDAGVTEFHLKEIER